MKILNRHRDRSEILESALFNEHSFYKQFYKDIQRAKKSVHIESPFLTKARTYELIKASKKTKAIIRVNTRHPSLHSGQMKRNAVKCIRTFKRHGIKVKTYTDYRHFKIAIIDDEILWEGSLNILSQSRSCEIMRRTESLDLCNQIHVLI